MRPESVGEAHPVVLCQLEATVGTALVAQAYSIDFKWIWATLLAPLLRAVLLP